MMPGLASVDMVTEPGACRQLYKYFDMCFILGDSAARPIH